MSGARRAHRRWPLPVRSGTTRQTSLSRRPLRTAARAARAADALSLADHLSAPRDAVPPASWAARPWPQQLAALASLPPLPWRNPAVLAAEEALEAGGGGCGGGCDGLLLWVHGGYKMKN